MTPGPLTGAVTGLRRVAEAQLIGELSDRQLLERFAGQRDEAAFAQLVRRHGAMVLGVCRRVLRHKHDAEDAFQAAFLVLARKAGSVRWQNSAGGWLFQVAYHLALKMRAGSDRRRMLPLPDVPVPAPTASQPDGELRALIDEELACLPEKYRIALLLCCCEGKTRAEAARQLGWKEGAVKIRLERGRALLRARLTRRGLTPSGVLVGAVLAADTAASALPPALVQTTTAMARAFVLGELSAAAASSSSAATLAGKVLRAMLVTRLRIAAVLSLTLSVALLGLGLGAHRVFAEARDEVSPLRSRPSAQQPGPAAAPAAKAPVRPLRVLLFAGAPSREYQFVRTLFAAQARRMQAELSVYLQTNEDGVAADPADRVLKHFPTRLATQDRKADDDDKAGNLARYDVVIAFDPDWTRLTAEQGRLLERWVRKEGGGLIVVAGPVHTWQLAHPANARQLQPIIDLLPVRLDDGRLVGADRDTSKPWPLGFPTATPFLKLDEEGKDPLAGWSEFFFGKEREDWQKTEAEPVRGFYAAYPVKSVRPGSQVLATFCDPAVRITLEGGKRQDLPYLVAMRCGKGRTIYLGSGETWRLRQVGFSFHERFWSQLAPYAASAAPARAGPPEAAPEAGRRGQAEPAKPR
jgi:RNA polymerase sigma factor (sigma-70 family)